MAGQRRLVISIPANNETEELRADTIASVTINCSTGRSSLAIAAALPVLYRADKRSSPRRNRVGILPNTASETTRPRSRRCTRSPKVSGQVFEKTITRGSAWTKRRLLAWQMAEAVLAQAERTPLLKPLAERLAIHGDLSEVSSLLS